MSKVVAVKDIGIPVPTNAPAATDAIACYFGAKGFTPDYAQKNRIALPLSSLSLATVNGVSYYDFPLSSVLPASVPDGDVDFCFTLVEGESEGDFSPVVTETVDRTPPQTLGQPVVLG